MDWKIDILVVAKENKIKLLHYEYFKSIIWRTLQSHIQRLEEGLRKMIETAMTHPRHA